VSAASYLDSLHDDEPGQPGPEETPDLAEAPTPVVVRRNAGLAALVGAASSAISIAYLWRATESGSALDWALCVVLAAIGVLYLVGLLDARTPLLVADELGVRIRFGHQWRGLPWDAVERALVRPRRGPLRDGRLMFAPYSLGRALDGLDARGRRTAAMNQKLYGAALAVPIGLGTRLSAHGQELADQLAALSGGSTEVQVGEPQVEDEATPVDEPGAPLVQEQSPSTDGGEPGSPADQDDQDEAEHPGHRRIVGGLATIVSRVAHGRSRDVDAEQASDELETDLADTDEPEPEPGEAEGAREPGPADRSVSSHPARGWAIPLRQGRRGLRADVSRDAPAATLGNAALADPELLDGPPRQRGHDRPELPEGDQLRRIDELDLREAAPAPHDDRVRPISRLADPLEPLVVDDFVTEPAYDPVIGPELAAARTRVGLSVDELAERTRIRPHVIESIEVDDFAPCGGDFYARGHLRTLARVLGKDPQPLLAEFDNRYATAPINARKVFEAELATGMTGSVRGTVGGPNWALLVGVVLVLVMAWGVVRLFASEPTELLQPPAPALNGSAGVDSGHVTAPKPVTTPKPIRVTLVGAQGDSHVVVRSRSGKVAWAGDIVLGERRTVKAAPPVRVHSSDAGALDVGVNGKDKGPLGDAGKPGHRTFRAAH